jgi:peptidoglycan/xylan/chitin deacetylase (PgdA/CDA1 family)
MRITALLVGAAALVGGYGLVFIVLPYLVKTRWLKRSLAQLKASGAVCLTFDDGPEPESTDRILDVLDVYGVKATFFMLGENVAKHPDLAKRVKQSGHEVGEHGHGHTHPWKSSPYRSLQDLLEGRRTLKRILNLSDEPILRPPYGKLNLMGLFYCLWYKKRVFFWDIDPQDYKQASPDSIVKAVAGKLGAGSVILLHDGRIARRRDTLALTHQSLAGILEIIKARKLRALTVSEAIDCHLCSRLS